MSIFHYLWWFLLALVILIAVHEYGHYLAARLCGVKVLRFSLGFGRPLFMREIGPDRTEWAVCAIPLGGYVRMLDEREAPVDSHERHRAFNTQALWKRSVIVVAGPLANFLLAIVLYWGIFVGGTTELAPIVGDVTPGSVAARAGFVTHDRIVRLDDEPIRTAAEFRWAIIDRAVDRETVEVELMSARGASEVRRLDLSSVEIDDRKPDVLGQVGLYLGPPMPPARIGRLEPGGVAEKAGLQIGDDVLRVADKPVSDWRSFTDAVRARPGMPTQLDIRRNGMDMQLELRPAAVRGEQGSIGRIGVGPSVDADLQKRYSVEIRDGVVGSLTRAFKQTGETAALSLKVIWRMITGHVSLRNVSGPLTIADYAGKTASMGAEFYLRLLAGISVGLGVLNLLPVPVLDGGHLLYHVAEFFRGRPLSERVMELGQRVGLALLVMLSVLALFNDINRLLPGG